MALPEKVTPGRSGRTAANWMWVVCIMICPLWPLHGQDAEYPVSAVNLEYETAREDLPPIRDFLDLRIPLTLSDGVYRSVLEEGDAVSVQLGNLSAGAVFSDGALQEVLNAMVAYLNSRDIYSVYVIPDQRQIDPRNGRDRRRRGDTALTIRIFVGQIQDIQSVAKGERIDIDEARPINAAEHSRILKNSPLQSSDRAEGRPDLFRREELNGYLRRLNRHPGRRVDATIASTGEPGWIDLHYLVTESKPWIAYAQVSNTGTKTVGEWQGRIGASHYQLTGNDDVLTVDYIASDPEDSYTAIAGYNFPVLFPDYLKIGLFFSYSEFEGSQFGTTATTGLRFTGRSILGGAEVRISPVAVGGFANDYFFGYRMEDLSVAQQIFLNPLDPDLDNPASESSGEDRLGHFYGGLSLSKAERKWNSFAQVKVEGNFDDVNPEQIDSLGRLFSDSSWILTEWDVRQSFYLEPLLFPGKWKDLDSWKTSTLANEIAFTVKGQYVLSQDRVIPQEQFVLGGLYSVRGYPESVAAADHGWYIQSEYRLHIPRMLRPYSDYPREERPRQVGGRYNLRPPRPLINPDWDFIVRLFTDFGQTENEVRDDTGEIAQFETDQQLWSAGAGLELRLANTFNLRADVGVVLDSLQEFDAGTSNPDSAIPDAQRGDVRFHLLATLSY